MNSIILNHIKDREGFATKGYLPTDMSGVTIGIGIDLGQQSKQGLIKLGVDQSIITKCEPYLGYKTKAELVAKNLRADQLALTVREAEDLSMPFIKDSYDKIEPYGIKMDDKGRAVLVSLRHWAGSLGSTSGKLCANNTNHVWNTIKDKTATNQQLKKALESTLPGKTVGTAAYNRIKHEINYLN